MFTNRRIIAVTGARSEYDIISPVLKLLSEDKNFELGLVVTGSHLSEAFGYSVQEIEKDGYNIVGRIYNLINSNEKIGRIISLGNQINPLAQIFNSWKPDIVLVVGDREEALSVSMTAAFMDIIVAHIAGGDIVKDGNIDNSIRYAASIFSHVHFTFTEQHKQNLLRLGEAEFRIFNVGNPALDKFIHTPKLDLKEISENLNFDISDGQFGLLLYHPIKTQFGKETDNIKIIIAALKETNIKFIVNCPNSDAGYNDIVSYYNKIESVSGQFKIVNNLDRNLYVNIMRHSKFMVGNSSSGIIEAPSIKLPVVNVGTRQKDRLNAGNVIFVDIVKEKIKEAIDICLSDGFVHSISQIENPYGKGDTAQKIVKILLDLKIDYTLTHKNISY